MSFSMHAPDRVRRSSARSRRQWKRTSTGVFATTIRSLDDLAALLASDPYKPFRLAPNFKRIVTLLHAKPKAGVKLPIEMDGARILCVKGTEVFSAYVPSPKGPVFMNLIEKTFGKGLTTRTWDTIGKVVKAGGS
jgi:hypothetical protein